jgi:hypothetical protein
MPIRPFEKGTWREGEALKCEEGTAAGEPS